MSSFKYAKSYKQRGAMGDLYVRSSVKAQPKKYRKSYKPIPRFTGPMPEIKFFDNAINFNFDATNEIPATGQLCAITQGDGQSQREGRKVVISSILFNGIVFTQPGAGATAGDLCYLWLVQDTQTNGAAATVANDDTGVFTAAGAVATAAVRCLANTDRFRILKKWVIPTFPGAGVTTAYNNMARRISWYYKCNIPIEYDASAATGAIATIRSNNLFLIAGSSSLTDDASVCTGTLRLRFTG